MPATSKTQQRLMGTAYAVKKGDMQISDVDASYRDKVAELVDNMTLKQLKDFAETSHEGLPEVKENGGTLAQVTPGMVGGMGSVVLPNAGSFGSGDAPSGIIDPDKNAKKKKKKKLLLTMNEFLVEYKKQIEPFSPEQPDEESIGQGEYEKGTVPMPDREFAERWKMQQRAKSIVSSGN